MQATLQKRTIDMDECRRMGIDIHVAGSAAGKPKRRTKSGAQGRTPPLADLGQGRCALPWSYDVIETCYLIERWVTVTPRDDTPLEIKAGDRGIFPADMRCTWEIHEPVLKHSTFG